MTRQPLTNAPVADPPSPVEILQIETAPRPGFTLAVLVCADLLALLLAEGLSVILRFPHNWPAQLLLYSQLWPACALFIFAYAVKGLYSGVALNPANELRRITLATNLVFLVLGAVIFLLKVSDQYSRSFFLIAWLLSILFVPLFRSLVRLRFAPQPWWGHPVVILGGGWVGRRVIETLMTHPEIGLKPVALLDSDPASIESGDIPLIASLDMAPQLAQQLRSPYAILALPEIPNEEFQTILEQYTHNFRQLVVIPHLLGFSSLWVEARDMDGLLGLEVRQQLLIPESRLLKRSVDLIGASLGLGLISPLLLLIALLVKLDSAGPLFFVQERLGHQGQLFKAYKFRSMYQDAEQRLHQILETDVERRREYEKFHKLRHDPRVTSVGRLLRKLSLDELPQLWNVIRGEMSLVGPRAYMPRERHEMEGKEHTILQVVPGITGLWQVSGRNHLSFQQRLDLDVYYVRNWSIWLDIHILARTIWVVLTGHGAL